MHVVPVVGVAAGSVLAGFVLAHRAGSLTHDRMLPWVLGRSLGIASYLSLVALVVLGMWLRHPWRPRRRPPVHPLAVLRAHVALAATTGALVVGHVLVLATDRYAGVGWLGAVVPAAAHYRPAAVALGIVGLYAGIAVAVTVLLAGSVARRLWLVVHRLAGWSLVMVWFHGVLAGTDTVALRSVYIGTGTAVLVLAVTRYLPSRTTAGPARGTGAAPGAESAAAAQDRPRAQEDPQVVEAR